MKKFGILLIFSVITFVGLNSVPTVFADHDGFIGPCNLLIETWDPNSNPPQCIPEDQCPNGASNGGIVHCALVPMMAVGGEFIGIDTTSVLVAGTQNTAAWMIPVIVSAIGIGIVVARKF